MIDAGLHKPRKPRSPNHRPLGELRAKFGFGPEYRRAVWIARHGITAERYDELLRSQGGVCAICDDPPTGAGLVIDHDHACCPGRWSCGRCVRGLLCNECNLKLTWFELHSEAAGSYLRERAGTLP